MEVIEIKESINSVVYFILNLINGKYYIGSSINWKKRWKDHVVELRLNRHLNKHLQSAWNMYGEESFQFIIVEEVFDTSKLEEIEQLWINASQCCDPDFGYNHCSVAGNVSGRKASEETKALLSAMRKGKPRSEEDKRKISEGSKGRIVSYETRLKLQLSHLGHKHSEETRKKMSKAKIGNTINNGRKQTKERIEKRVAHLRGRKHDKPRYRKIDKWPCLNGRKCKCELCMEKKREYKRNWRQSQNISLT